MKYLISSILLLLIYSTSLPTSVSAQEQESWLGDRFSLKVGYRMWLASWNAPNPISTGPGFIHSPYSSGTTVFSGPAITGSFYIRESEWLNTAFVNFTWLNGGFQFADFGSQVGAFS